jgi:hypothetical protein
MSTNDWHEVPPKYNISMFSVNGVPYPLDEWLKLKGEMTTDQCAELVKRWYIK